VPVEPLVDAATWERVQQQLARNRTNARRNAKREYLLRGRIRCGCGRVLRAYYTSYFDRAYYRCPQTAADAWHSSCDARFGLEQTKVEGAVLATIKAFLLDPDVRRAALDGDRARADAERDRLAAEVATLDAKLAQIDRQLAKLLDATLMEAFPADQITAHSRELTTERAHALAERERRLADRGRPEQAVDVEAAIAALEPTVEAAFTSMQPDELRRLFDLLRLDVTVLDKDRVRLTGIVEGIITLSSR
jgi:hypothetical protein